MVCSFSRNSNSQQKCLGKKGPVAVNLIAVILTIEIPNNDLL
jgi:hypothetical protein